MGLIETFAATFMHSKFQEVSSFVVIMFALIFCRMDCWVCGASGRFDFGRLVGCRGVLVALLVVLCLLPIVANPYLLFIGNLILIYIILAIGLNLLVGFAGHLAFANAAMFGIGAYGARLLRVDLGLPFYLALPGGSIAMLVGTTMALRRYG